MFKISFYTDTGNLFFAIFAWAFFSQISHQAILLKIQKLVFTPLISTIASSYMVTLKRLRLIIYNLLFTKF